MTNRELEILTWVTKGERYLEIALRLGVIERRVDAHLASVLILLGVDSRNETVSLVMNCGLFDLFFFVEEAMLDEKGLASNKGHKQLVQDLLLSKYYIQPINRG